jgi:hypothetical protein
VVASYLEANRLNSKGIIQMNGSVVSTVKHNTFCYPVIERVDELTARNRCEELSGTSDGNEDVWPEQEPAELLGIVG